jgi:hypothetical protein
MSEPSTISSSLASLDKWLADRVALPTSGPSTGVKWNAQLWLDPRVKSQIDWRVVHMSSLSGMDFPRWNLAKTGAALCDQIERFLKTVEDEVPARLPALNFNGARSAAQTGAALFNQYV